MRDSDAVGVSDVAALNANSMELPDMLARILAAIEEGRVISGIRSRVGPVTEPLREWQLRRRLGQGAARYPIHWTNKYPSPLGDRLRLAFEAADSGSVALPPHIRELDGMSGQKYRSLINRLVNLTPEPKYLEVGSWTGSTACSAMIGNRMTVCCIDNWALFGGPKDLFFANVGRIQSPEINFHFIENDFRGVNFSALGKFNIYLYDGPHSEQAQYDAVCLARAALDQKFILIIDDWNRQAVRLGSFRGIADSGMRILSSVEIRTTPDNTDPTIAGRDSDWHNGYLIAAIELTSRYRPVQPVPAERERDFAQRNA